MIKLKMLMNIFVLLIIPISNFIGFAAPGGNNSNGESMLLTPTASATSTGIIAIIKPDNDQINVRSGPKTTYPQIGILLARAEVSVYGISIGQDWIQVAFPESETGSGWIYAPLVTFIEGNPDSLPVIIAPATPTPDSYPTIDPTLAAQFIEDIPPTKLPTFTPPGPLEIATFPTPIDTKDGEIPMGIIIVSIFGFGSFAGLISILLKRNSRK